MMSYNLGYVSDRLDLSHFSDIKIIPRRREVVNVV